VTACHDHEGSGLVLLTAIVGSVPWLGVLVAGRWSAGELGIATAFLVFAARQGLAAWSAARRSEPD
jgi:hypothetical protein